MASLRRFGLAGLAAVAVTGLCAAPAQAAWGGGYRGGYGYGGYRGFGYGFGVGLAVGGLYGGYYRPYGYYPQPYYVSPPVVYAPPPVYLAPPAVYVGPPPRPRRVVHRVRAVPAVPQCRCLPPVPSSVPAPLRDVPSPGP